MREETMKEENVKEVEDDGRVSDLGCVVRRSVLGRIFDVLSGFGLATVLLLLLGLLTWLATLEQIDHGLYATLQKYFDWKSVVVFPELVIEMGGKPQWVQLPFPLLSGYWVSVLLLVNLVLGGIVRARKGWRHVGSLIAHFGIVLLVVGAGVTQLFSERGNLRVTEGEVCDVAVDESEAVVEVTEVKEGRKTAVYVIRARDLTDLVNGRVRSFQVGDFPGILEIGGFQKHAFPVSAVEFPPRNGELVVDGYYLLTRPEEKEAEGNLPGCYVRVVQTDGTKSAPILLSCAARAPLTVELGGRVFTLDMHKRYWPMPFGVRLDHFTAEFHPGTRQPAKFVSEITRLERSGEGEGGKATIQMNEPMRYAGLTFFQSSYGRASGGQGKPFSVFAVVGNPADRWPEYSLYVVTVGLLVSFLTKLGGYLFRTRSGK